MGSEALELDLPGPRDTLALGEFLGRHLRAGQTLALVGELGAGKTLLARGLARGLGVDDPEAVCSPTYLLVIEHAGPVPLLHADAYLPAKLEAFLADGGLDYLWNDKGVVVVEWADRIAGLMPEGALWLELLPARDGPGRRARFRPGAREAFPWLTQLPNMDPTR